MDGEPGSADQIDERFRNERRRTTRGAVLVGGALAALGVPLWSLFDFLVAPDQAGEFLVWRLIATAAIAALWVVGVTPYGRRRPEPVAFGMLVVVQLLAALMIGEVTENVTAYALGLTLAIFATALLVWPMSYTLAVVGFTGVALAFGWIVGSPPVAASDVASVCFFVLTAAVIAIASQAIRDRAARQQFETRLELEHEQVRGRELVRRLDRLSREDSLTGLANRRAWDEAVGRECALVGRAGGMRTLSVLLCDVDQLKDVNDRRGHLAGDDVLRGVAEMLRRRLRAADLVARIGGDEFAALLVGADQSAAATLAEELRSQIWATALTEGGAGKITVSIGVAGWDGGEDSLASLMSRADRRLYRAKASRNVVCASDRSSAVGPEPEDPGRAPTGAPA